LNAIENAKISCAEKLFNSLSDSKVKYHKVTNYQDLINAMSALG
jgi:type III restriction enzyme